MAPARYAGAHDRLRIRPPDAGPGREHEAPARAEWARPDSSGVIELTASGCGTRVRAVAHAKGVPWERVEAHRDLQLSLERLLDHLGARSLRRGAKG